MVSDVMFLLGAGASVDVGLPLVKDLTCELRDRLSSVRDINGKKRPEFRKLFDIIANHDGEVTTNYEQFFEWISLFRRGQKNPFCKLVRFDLDQDLITAAAELAFVIKKPIWDVLRSRHQCPTYSDRASYFAKIGDFLSDRDRLKVFTTNYDLCIEDACRSKNIDVCTGFDSTTGKWNPILFGKPGPAINLYKLHGSLNWSITDSAIGELQNIVEFYPPKWDKEPGFILGPGTKLQFDDPWAALYSEFQQALKHTRVCIAVGVSFRDPHIMVPIRDASYRQLKVIDVNPSCVERKEFPQYVKIRKGAKEAFESGKILEALRSPI